jgi:hypothetical protein
MDHIALLAVFAQLAVSLTGFAGLLTAFRGAEVGWSEQEVAGIRNLLLTSVGALAFSVLPIPALAAGVSANEAYRWTSLGLGAFLVILFAGGLHYVLRLKGRPRSWAFYLFFTIGGAPLGAYFIVQALNAAAGPGAYVVGLIWLLAIGVVQFMFQIFSTLTPKEK